MSKKLFYEERARAYGRLDAEGLLRYRKALALAGDLAGCRVLDVGCKMGLLRDLLRRTCPGAQYKGVDISEAALAAIPDRRDDFLVADVMEGLPLPEASFDVAFCLELIEHVESPTRLLAELKRVVRPGGLILLSTPSPYYPEEFLANLLGLPEREGHIAAFSPRNVRRLLAFAGLELETFRGTWLRLPYWPFRPIRRGLFLKVPVWPALFTVSIIYRVRVAAAPGAKGAEVV